MNLRTLLIEQVESGGIPPCFGWEQSNNSINSEAREDYLPTIGWIFCSCWNFLKTNRKYLWQLKSRNLFEFLGVEGCILAVKSHEGLETLFLAIICCDLKTASLAAPYCGTEASFCAFNVKNVERKVPRERLSRKHDNDVIKVSSSIQKKVVFFSENSPQSAPQHPAGAGDPLSEKSPDSLRRSITHLHRCVVFSSLHFIPFDSLSVCKNRENLDSSGAIAFQIKQKWIFSPSFVTTPDDSNCDVHILLLLQINCTNKDMHDCSNWQEARHRRCKLSSPGEHDPRNVLCFFNL